MKMMTMFLSLALAFMALATDITGKWKGSIDTPNGAMDITFDFKADGDKLTGTATGPAGDVPITDIKTEGDHIEFTVDTGQFKIVHKGTISQDEMKLTVEMGDGQTSDMTVKRSKE